MKNFLVKLNVPNEPAMLALGARVAKMIKDGVIIFLNGDLGAGKTTFTRGFLRELGFKGHVKSPTYTLVEHYQLKNNMVYHFDFYRLRDSEELEYIGIQDYFDPKNICIVEWGLLVNKMLPQPDLTCEITPYEKGRHVQLVPQTERGYDILHGFENE